MNNHLLSLNKSSRNVTPEAFCSFLELMESHIWQLALFWLESDNETILPSESAIIAVHKLTKTISNKKIIEFNDSDVFSNFNILLKK